MLTNALYVFSAESTFSRWCLFSICLVWKVPAGAPRAPPPYISAGIPYFPPISFVSY